MENVDDILRENERRLKLFSDSWDPLAGNPRDPLRVSFSAPGIEPCHVPAAMLDDLAAYGNVERDSGERTARMTAAVPPEIFDRIRIRHDFPYWCARHVRIKSKGGDDVPFYLNHPQRRLVKVLEEMRRARKPIRLILLKARQWGGSTCIQMYMAWMQLVQRRGLNSLILAQNATCSLGIRDMFSRMLSQYPARLLSDDNDAKPGKITESAGINGLRILPRNCKIMVGSSENPDACRGHDYNLLHLSEVALWKESRLKKPEDLFRAATAGVMLHPDTMIVLESTANGTGNFFHTEYCAARAGKSQMKAFFIPWHAVGQYSLPFAAGGREAFAERLIALKDEAHSPEERGVAGSYLRRLWEMGATLEAMNWYVAERVKFKSHSSMASEYPSDDCEAFAHSGTAVFDIEKLEALRGDCTVNPLRGEIAGNSVEGKGALMNVRFTPSPTGELLMWKDRPDPEQGCGGYSHRYLVVVDVGGRSHNADWSVIAVFDRAAMEREDGRPEIAAQWRGHIDLDLLAWKAAAIARYYDDALLVFESNTIETREYDRQPEPDSTGFLLGRLRNVYHNLYARRGSEEDIRTGKPRKYGFHTNTRTKPLVINMLITCIRNHGYVERDERCVNEYEAYERKPNGSYGAKSGHHDDILMTRAIGLHICINEMERPRKKSPGGRVDGRFYRSTGGFSPESPVYL